LNLVNRGSNGGRSGIAKRVFNGPFSIKSQLTGEIQYYI